MSRRELQKAIELVDKAIAKAARDDPSAVEIRTMTAARLELARALHHLGRSRSSGRLVVSHPRTPKVTGLMSYHPHISGDTPSELIEQSDGVSDDGALDQQIIGACACDAVGSGLRQHLSVSGLGDLTVAGLGDLAVGSGLRQHLSVSGLGDLTIAGVPGYLFTEKNLSNPVLRRRLGAAIKAMTPKLRRRVVARLKVAAVAASRSARVSGAVRNMYPTVAGGGWSGVSVGRCPYANVAGALTP